MNKKDMKSVWDDCKGKTPDDIIHDLDNFAKLMMSEGPAENRKGDRQI